MPYLYVLPSGTSFERLLIRYILKAICLFFFLNAEKLEIFRKTVLKFNWKILKEYLCFGKIADILCYKLGEHKMPRIGCWNTDENVNFHMHVKLRIKIS